MSRLASSVAGPSSLANSTRVTLTPTPGFCVKSVTTEPGFYVFAASPAPVKQDAKLLEPSSSAPRTLQIPKGVKVFLNIAWDKNVPPPPPADEAVVRRAMMGEDLDDAAGIGEGAYYVPVVVGEPREDRDKAGKPSVVIDAVFNPSLKSRCTKDPDFKLYIIELALEHVEEKAHVLLSRQIGSPNIASKGKLETRTVLIPTALLDGDSKARSAAASEAKPLIQEVAVADGRLKGRGPNTNTSIASSPPTSVEQRPPQASPKSILKNAKPHASATTARSQPSLTSTSSPSSTNVTAGSQSRRPLIEELPDSGATATDSVAPIDLSAAGFLPAPKWSWTEEGERLRIDIEVPKLTRALHAISALDIEARRVLLYVPKTYFLDINLDLSDAQIGKLRTMSVEPSLQDKDKDEVKNELDVGELRIRGHNAGEVLRLKRQRDLDVDNARSEWRIGERKIVIWA